MLDWKFACPRCMSVLNPNKRMIFKVTFGGRSALMLLSSHLGDYESTCEPAFGETVKHGDQVDFSCPVCSESLAVTPGDRFAEVLQVFPDRKPRRIRFSQVCGEHATFTIDTDVQERFGEHADLYEDLNFSETDSWW